MSILLLVATVALAPGNTLAVQASEAALPCATAASRAYERSTGQSITVTAGAIRSSDADVLIAFDVEMTRALEGGDAVDGSEQDLARIPWVLAVSPHVSRRIRSLADLRDGGEQVWMLAGPVAHEARRALLGAPGVSHERVHETSDRTALAAATIALVPLSLAPQGETIAVDIPPLTATAAVGARAKRPQAARSLVLFLASDAGKTAFTSCGNAR